MKISKNNDDTGENWRKPMVLNQLKWIKSVNKCIYNSSN